jgi:neutral trehalase
LFTAVQSAHLFADGKTFADAVPKSAPSEIMARYRDVILNAGNGLPRPST